MNTNLAKVPGTASLTSMRLILRTGGLAPLSLLGGALILDDTLGDTIELKDEASIKGRVVAEKSEHVAVDVGYTILMVPRSAIANITTPKSEEEAKDPKGENTIPPGNTTP